MSDDAYTGFTVSFKPGGTGYDSPMLVVRGNTEEELLVRLDSDPDDDIGTAVGRYHAKLRKQFEEEVGGGSAPLTGAVPISSSAPAPIWKAAAATASVGLTPNPDGTYPPCPHGSRNRKPWTSPKNGKVYLFCALDRGTPGACQTVTL